MGHGSTAARRLAIVLPCVALLATAGCADQDGPASKGLAARLLAALPSLRSDAAAPKARGRPRLRSEAATGPVRARLIRVAEREWHFFGGAEWRYNRPSVGRARLEYQPGARERIQHYWSYALGRTVRDTRRVGWSGAFISYVMKKAGARHRFPYSGTHTTYIARAIENRKRGRLNAPIVGFRLSQYAPRPGDLVCDSLTAGIDYDHINRRYAAHCDIVVGRGFRRIEVIGGNLTNSVRKRVLLTDDNGFVFAHQPRRIDPYVKRWFVIIKVNM